MHEIRIPKLGLDSIDCDISKWLVKVGDRVSPGTPLLEVETEKAVVAIEAQAGGVVREIHVKPGDNVAVGAVIGLIEE